MQKRVSKKNRRRHGPFLMITLVLALGGAVLTYGLFARRGSVQSDGLLSFLAVHHRQVATIPANASSEYPSQVLNLQNWYLTLPVSCSEVPGGSCQGTGSGAGDVFQPALATFTSPYFYVDGTNNAVVFRSDVEGATTPGSSYPRSELREMTDNGTEHASWSTTTGTNTMVVTEAITHLPVVKAQVVAAQIHNASNDVIEVIADGPGVDHLGPGQYKLCVRFGPNQDQETGPCLDTHYSLGAFYTLTITAADGRIEIWYAKGSSPAPTTSTPIWQRAYKGSSNYFKAGAYTQSNLKHGDKSGAYGEVEIGSLQVTHQ